jgi:isochorismate pyruvate lyase
MFPRGTVANVSLSVVRARIDAIDEQIVRLLAARQILVKEAAQYKTDQQAVRAPDRRVAMMVRRRELAIQEGVSPEVVRRVYEAMIDAFIDLELQEHAQISEGCEITPHRG